MDVIFLELILYLTLLKIFKKIITKNFNKCMKEKEKYDNITHRISPFSHYKFPY